MVKSCSSGAPSLDSRSLYVVASNAQCELVQLLDLSIGIGQDLCLKGLIWNGGI
jgi:hypothetical protein